MIRHHLKIAGRFISRHKIYTAINTVGLALGICVCIVIYLITSYELIFDDFHPGKDRIYRVMGDVTESTGDKSHFARIPLVVSRTVRGTLPGLDLIAGVSPYYAKISIPDSNKQTKHFESSLEGTHYPGIVIAEPQYFDIFKYVWLAGNAATALNEPFRVVLALSKARQYFGSGPPDKMLGREVIYDDSLKARVSGIVKDWDKNTDLGFTNFISFSTVQSSFLKNNFNPDSWGRDNMSTFIFAKLGKGTVPGQLNTRMNGLVKKFAGPEAKLALWLEPLADIHFNGDIIENPVRTAHKPTLYGLTGIALFILLLAIINFINLSTAQSIDRAKEVGVRKVMGSSRGSLVFQFLTETLLLTFFALLLAISLVGPVLTAFHAFIPTGVTFHFFNPYTWIFFVLVTLITSLLAGWYPAKVLSSYLPAQSLKGAGAQGVGKTLLLRKGLIIFQFSVSLVFIIASIVIASQLSYTRKKDLGFTADSIVMIETPRGDSLNKIAVLREKVKQLAGISKVALQWVPPMTGNGRGHPIKFKSTDEKATGVTQVAGNEDLIPLYQIKILAGRNLVPADSLQEFVINENLSRLMGSKNPGEAIGKMLYWDDKPYPVVGVVADFHTRSFHDPITPLCIVHRPDREGTLAIKIAAKGKESDAARYTLAQVEKIWKTIYPAANFNYRFYDESLALLYEKDQHTAILMNAAMAITIFISCMGLFGLAMFSAAQRTKEIGIRKVLGASVFNIIAMLSKEVVLLVLIATLVASPVAWYFMNKWLQDFAYRTSIHPWLFILAGLAALLIALATVSVQAIKAAVANPVKSLRTE